MRFLLPVRVKVDISLKYMWLLYVHCVYSTVLGSPCEAVERQKVGKKPNEKVVLRFVVVQSGVALVSRQKLSVDERFNAFLEVGSEEREFEGRNDLRN